MLKSFIGVIGLGVMGKSLSLNIAEKNVSISVYNRVDNGEEHVVPNFLEQHKTMGNLLVFTNLKSFVESLESPKKIILMIHAGMAVDAVLNQLEPLLSPGDVVLDGGNSHYLDTKKRVDYLKQKNIHFIGCGISGGEEGARKGPSLMPGGTLEGYKIIAPVLELIAAKDKNQKPCCTYVGPEGAGHFVKMVHNGIEYVEMQLLAEVYALLSMTRSNDEISKLLSQWNSTNLSSYLLDITSNILKKKDGDAHLVDRILDKASNKGTGSWSSKAALDLGAVNSMMASAVFSRYISTLKEQRVTLSKHIKKNSTSLKAIDLDLVKDAYQFSRILNHHQGFELMRLASVTYNWNLNLSEIARTWTNGCIIRSVFMEESVAIFQKNDSYLDSESILKGLIASEKNLVETLTYGLLHRIALDTFSAGYSYWVAITNEHLPANLIQAQRDYFGAHTYQLKNDASQQFYHTNWLEA